jgi:RND family efflux transporter MFP subunit
MLPQDPRRLNRLGPALAVLAAMPLGACGQAAPSASTSPARTLISVTEAPARLGTIASVLSYSGTVSELRIQQGQRVDAGELLAVLDHRALDDQLAQATANVSAVQAKLRTLQAGARSEDVAAAKAQASAAQGGVAQAAANLESARQKLAQAQAGGRAEVVAQAQAKLDADKAALNKLINGPQAQDVTSARLAVELAKDKLFADQTNYDFQVHNGLMSKEMRQSALDADQTAIDQANTQLAKLLAPPRTEDAAQARAAVEADQQALAVARQPNRPEDIAQLEQAVAAAQGQLTQAQQQTAALQAAAAKAASPYTPEDLDQARAAVEVAQAAAHGAQTAVDDATIVAPAAGLIGDVPIAVGSLVSPQTPVATLISTSVEIDATVEEGQVAQIGAGQPARIHALSASDVPGQVLSVAPQADSRTRKFMVKVVPVTIDSPLRAGMSATVDIQTGRQQEAVLVPRSAVIQRNGRQIVFVDDSGHAKMVPVTTGYSDDNQVQLQTGVDAGALVILPGSLELADGDAVKPVPTVPPAK